MELSYRPYRNTGEASTPAALHEAAAAFNYDDALLRDIIDTPEIRELGQDFRVQIGGRRECCRSIGKIVPLPFRQPDLYSAFLGVRQPLLEEESRHETPFA